MGMFDYVHYEMSCPGCLAPVTDWQSKDGPCQLETLEPHQVGYFYTHCACCGQWICADVTVADPADNCPHCGQKMPNKVRITVRPIDPSLTDRLAEAASKAAK